MSCRTPNRGTVSIFATLPRFCDKPLKTNNLTPWQTTVANRGKSNLPRFRMADPSHRHLPRHATPTVANNCLPRFATVVCHGVKSNKNNRLHQNRGNVAKIPPLPRRATRTRKTPTVAKKQTTAEILSYLHAHTLSLRLDGEELLVSPRANITEEVRKVIKANKARLVRHLLGEQAQADRAYTDPPEWGAGHVVERDSLLVTLAGKTVAVDPAQWEEFTRQVAEWNARAVQRAREQEQAIEQEQARAKQPRQKGLEFGQ